MTRGIRGRIALTLVALLMAAAAATAATAEDPELREALGERDVYASPEALGTLAGVVEERLAVRAVEMAERSQPVKLAIVSGYGGEGPFAYAARLRRELGYDDTLVITTPQGPTGAAGPRATRSIQGAFRARHVDSIDSATQRLITASGLAVPPPPDPDPAPRGLLLLVGLTVLGGIWAVTWGVRREQRAVKTAVAERRALLRLGFDALEAQIDAADSGSSEVDPRLQAARAHLEAGRTASRLGRSDDMDDAADELDRGCRALFGEDTTDRGRRLFAGLCVVDPAHGSATALGRVPGRELPAPLCDGCRSDLPLREPLARRQVPFDGGAVPWDEIDPATLLARAGVGTAQDVAARQGEPDPPETSDDPGDARVVDEHSPPG